MTSLAKKVEDIVKDAKKDDANKSMALRKAEELADKFHDVKPKTDIAPIEKFFGLPVASKQSSP